MLLYVYALLGWCCLGHSVSTCGYCLFRLFTLGYVYALLLSSLARGPSKLTQLTHLDAPGGFEPPPKNSTPGGK